MNSELLTLDLRFKIEGKIREVFDQKNWERAYDKHDNSFRVTIQLEVRSGPSAELHLEDAAWAD